MQQGLCVSKMKHETGALALRVYTLGRETGSGRAPGRVLSGCLLAMKGVGLGKGGDGVGRRWTPRRGTAWGGQATLMKPSARSCNDVP